METYYVYIIIDPRTQQPFYVGKGHGDRYKHHRYNRNRFPSRPVSCRFLEILQEGYPDAIYSFPFHHTNEPDAYLDEIKLIENYGRVDLQTGPLLNQTSGGEGWSHNRKWSEVTRRQRELNYKNKPRGNAISQYTLDSVFVSSFSSSNHATRSLGLPLYLSSRIRECCRGEANSAAGFMWAYLNNPPPTFLKSSRRKVKQFTKAGTFIKEYVSISLASEETGINAGDISNMCKNGRYKSVGGFVWQYAL